jgi:hypothetical protein
VLSGVATRDVHDVDLAMRAHPGGSRYSARRSGIAVLADASFLAVSPEPSGRFMLTAGDIRAGIERGEAAADPSSWVARTHGSRCSNDGAPS